MIYFRKKKTHNLKKAHQNHVLIITKHILFFIFHVMGKVQVECGLYMKNNLICMVWILCSSKQSISQGLTYQFHHLCFIMIQMCTFKNAPGQPSGAYFKEIFTLIKKPTIFKQNDNDNKIFMSNILICKNYVFGQQCTPQYFHLDFFIFVICKSFVALKS